jgi:outer membrane receptor protein involved in Fe transport
MLPIKNIFFLALFVSFFANSAFSQNAGQISGITINNNVVLEFVSVFLTSQQDTNKVIASTGTDSLGKFFFSPVPAGNYILRTRSFGYLPVKIEFSVDTVKNVIDLGKITLLSDTKVLEGVDVVVQRDIIKKTPQGFIFSAKDNLTQASGTATDLLRNIPTVVVDAEGAITVRGKSPLILVNGRNSTLSATDRIPASSIESIEIINNPTAQYDADAEGGIINIKLKKNTAMGTTGSIGLGGGLGAHGRANSSFIISHQTKKWNIGLAYDNRFAQRTRKIKADRTNFYLPEQYSLIQNRSDDKFDQTQNSKLNIDFTPNSKHQFNFEAIANMDGQDNIETLGSMFRTQTDSFQTNNSRKSTEIGREKVAELSLNYLRKFDDKRKSLTANISTSFDFDSENTDITTTSLYEDNRAAGDPFIQRTYNYQNSNVSNFRVDYAHPMGKRGTLEAGYKGITRFTNADFQSQYLVSGDFVKNPLQSNVFNFQEQVHAAYLQYRGSIGKSDTVKWKYDLGLRAEQVYNEGKGSGNDVFVKREYFNLFPTANLAYYITQSDFLKISIGRRINRPNLEQLNPFTDLTDSLSQHSGNPYLRPELANSLEFGYNKEWKKVSFNINLYYRYTTNIIRGYVILKDNGVTLNQPVNFGVGETYGAESIVSIFPLKFWSANISASCYQQNISGSNIDPALANNVFSWYGKLINNFTLWKGGKLQIMTNYNSPIGTPQGKKIAVYYTDLGFQQKIFKGKGGLGLVITDVFNTQLSGSTIQVPEFNYSRIAKNDTRAVMLTFAYTFRSSFKEEMIENKFSND